MSLGFLPCAVLFLRACSLSSFPSCRFTWGFPVTGCLSFCFPGDVGWASALPFFFCASPAPLACRGRRGYAPCVRVLQLRWCLLGLKVRSPCSPSLPLGWVCFWPAGVSGVCGLQRRSRLPFVVRHGLGYVDRVLWPLDGPGACCFLEPSLGFFPLASSVGCWLEVVEVYPWLSSLRSFAVEGVDLVLCQVFVGLPSWCCCASGLLGPVVFLLFLLGHLSQVRSVFFLSPRP